MNVLVLDQFSEPGGAQLCLLDLLPAMLQKGWKVTVAMPGSGRMFERVAALGGSTLTLDSICRPGPRYFWDSWSLRQWVQNVPSDFVYVNGPRVLPAAAIGLKKRPALFHAHNRLRLAGASIARWGIARMRGAIAVCRHVAEPLRLERVIYNGVTDTGFREPNREIRRIGVIGRIAREKGQLEFLRAAKLLGDRFEYVICGAPQFSGARYENEVRRLAEGLPVEFTGWTEDVTPILRNLDLLVVPSIAEPGTTRVILEAYSAGVPVVAFATGGIPEVIDDGVTAFLCWTITPEALAERIRQAVATDLAVMAREARRTYERRFTLERWRNEVIAEIEKAAGDA
jgi:glycosyltransferase involved in cell wall biosynthesis